MGGNVLQLLQKGNEILANATKGGVFFSPDCPPSPVQAKSTAMKKAKAKSSAVAAAVPAQVSPELSGSGSGPVATMVPQHIIDANAAAAAMQQEKSISKLDSSDPSSNNSGEAS